MPAPPSPLADSPFSYIATKTGKVLISHRDKQAKILQGRAASKFLEQIESLSEPDAQLLMARVTGQFKFGNERTGKLADKSRTC